MKFSEKLLKETTFSEEFWINLLKELGYSIKKELLDVPILVKQRALTQDFAASRVLRLYVDDYVEIVVVSSDDSISRSLSTRVARLWKENRLIKPLLLFTDGKKSYAVIVPGKGIGGGAKVLGLTDQLYRTDLDVLESIRYPGDVESLRSSYDNLFFPYEKVREDFFEGYRDLYQKLEKSIRDILKDKSTSYAQRFLGRLMFTYFLQRKGWLKNNKRFIDTIKDYGELNTLFYESLNKEGTPGIPFLNGSLFEREEYMDKTREKNLCKEMDPIFKEARDFFNQYNFTVDEASPLDIEVSIDPALIGTVFENMLPENERGGKGTFYTPKNESSFICRRALSNYLGLKDEIRVKADGKEEFLDGLSEYVKKLKEMKSEREIREFKNKLMAIKVLDPAVGSGGFLLVMMQEMIGLIHEAEETVSWRTDPEELKEKILPNLYGFDIEPEAVEIARLRLWLSLIIDQKEPEPLPNLDMNLMAVKDSLNVAPQMKLDLYTKYEELRRRTTEIRTRYLNEHDGKTKNTLRAEHEKLLNEIERKTGVDPSVIENLMTMSADIIVMNPPYVRQESIPKEKKESYVKRFGLDKKSDLYAYFLVRALQLLSDKGVAAVIASDKWLETGYGISLQKKLFNHIMAIYGQRMRSFGADINTAIVVYGKEKRIEPVGFTYVETYGSSEVRRSSIIQRNALKPGKWFYLRAPKFFLDNILPKLNHTLSPEFSEIKFGIKTGANDFFYMKDITHLYETDYLANPVKFQNEGIKAKTGEELEKSDLIYVENEGGGRFVVDRKDVAPIVRSPKEIDKYSISKLNTLCLYTSSPGSLTAKYIKWGEEQTVQVKGGKDDRLTVSGYHNLESIKNRKPWFKLTNLGITSNIILPKSNLDKLFISYSEKSVICDNRLYSLKAKNIDPKSLWIYLNSTIFLIVIELFCRRLGGGGGASDIMVEDYEIMSVPDLAELHLDYDPSNLLNRTVLRYYEEIKQDNRRKLDVAVLKALGFADPEGLVHKVHESFVEIVDDRLVKAARSLRRKIENGEND